MAISIDSVRDTVLTILNKEQRGYLPAAEFNQLAKQAQLEIFESYFYDLGHFTESRKGMVGGENYADIVRNIKEKIDVFSEYTTLTYNSNSSSFEMPSNFYRLNTVLYTGGDEDVIIEQIDKSRLAYINSAPLLKPDTDYPKYVRVDNNVQVYPTTIQSDVTAFYIKRPTDPIWNSVTFGDDEIYNADTSTDFELSDAEQYLLVEKILGFAGLVIREPEIAQIAGQEQAVDNANKKT